MIDTLKNLPSWFVLCVLFVALLVAYYVRPDNVTEDLLKGVSGALLLSLRSVQLPPPPPPVTP